MTTHNDQAKKLSRAGDLCFDATTRSPNFDPEVIPVEFVVLHYTACTKERAIKLFLDPQNKTSAHIILDSDGSLYEIVPCLIEPALKAWHSGKSFQRIDEKDWENFNAFSIGVEIVNFNGNIFSYTDAQYDALTKLLRYLKQRYPALDSPDRIIGHDQIAGFRGKCDPGSHFDWKRLLSALFPEATLRERPQIIPAPLLEPLRELTVYAPHEGSARDNFYSQLSLLCERITSALQQNQK